MCHTTTFGPLRARLRAECAQSLLLCTGARRSFVAGARARISGVICAFPNEDAEKMTIDVDL